MNLTRTDCSYINHHHWMIGWMKRSAVTKKSDWGSRGSANFFGDDKDLEKIVDTTPEGVPSGALLPVTPAPLPSNPTVPPGRDDDDIPNLIKAGNSDDISIDYSIIGFVPESEGELWADHPYIVPDIEPQVLPPPEPPPSPAVSSNKLPSQAVREDIQPIAHRTRNNQSQPSEEISPQTWEPGWSRNYYCI